MAQIFGRIPGLTGLMDYWYHFAIMFEALFILTTIDAGTRVARFLVQEFFGQFYKPFARQDWMPGTIVATTLVVISWAYFIWTGGIDTIWPMFGIANQLLAVVALAIGTTILVNLGRARYAWVTAAPMVFLAITTLSAGVLSVKNNFWPKAVGANPALHIQGWVDTVLTVMMMICAIIILTASARRWRSTDAKPAPNAVGA